MGRRRHDCNVGEISECLIIPFRDRPFFFQELLHQFQLSNADGSMQIRQAIVEPDLHMEEFESLVFRLRREVPRVFCTFRIAGENHSSTAGGDGLVSIEAYNTSISGCTYMESLVMNLAGSYIIFIYT